MFVDRIHAATQLLGRLQAYKGQDALILAIPRGGVALAKVIADGLDAQLDLVLVHKLGHPANPEYAIGAVDEEGRVALDEDAQGLDPNTLAKQVTRQMARLKSLRTQYTPLKKRIDPKGKTVIIVDDGIATGWTVKAAIAALRRAKAKRIVVATPVGPKDSLREIEALADELVCLLVPPHFSAVGQFYTDFSEVSDEDVAALLKAS